MSAVQTAVRDAPEEGPVGSVGAVAVSRDCIDTGAACLDAWRVRVQCLDGGGRLFKVAAYGGSHVEGVRMSDGQAAVEEWSERHGLVVVWSVMTPRLAVGFLVRGDR